MIDFITEALPFFISLIDFIAEVLPFFISLIDFIAEVLPFISLIAAIISLRVAYRAWILQKKADKDLEKMDNSITGISDTQENLKLDVKKTEDNTKSIKQTAEQMKKHIDKTYFQMEKSIALNKYQHLDNEDLKEKFNESYQPFMFLYV